MLLSFELLLKNSAGGVIGSVVGIAMYWRQHPRPQFTLGEVLWSLFALILGISAGTYLYLAGKPVDALTLSLVIVLSLEYGKIATSLGEE